MSLKLDASVNSVKWPKNLLYTSNSRIFVFDAKSKYERIFHFKLCVYLAYFRSYCHLKIDIFCNFVHSAILKWLQLLGKCRYKLYMWLTDISVDSVK